LQEDSYIEQQIELTKEERIRDQSELTLKEMTVQVRREIHQLLVNI